MNKVLLIGHIGQDPSVRYLPDGSKVASFDLATKERWKDDQGARQESTEWHRIAVFGGLADVIENHTKKGSQLHVEGRNMTRKWTDKNYPDVTRYSTEVVVSGRQGRIELLGSPSAGKPASQPDNNSAPPLPESRPEDDG